jgi:ribosomal protein S18 acetylase RimI-like enzyme
MSTYSLLNNPTPSDLGQIAELYREAGWWADAPQELAAVGRIVAGSHCFMVARSDRRIVGMGRALSDRASDAYIQDVTVTASHRGRGVARQIVRAILERLRADGIGWIALVAERGTRGLYEPLGFAAMPDAVPMLLATE